MLDPELKPIETPHSDAVTVDDVINQEALDKLLGTLTPEKAMQTLQVLKSLKSVLNVIVAL